MFQRLCHALGIAERTVEMENAVLVAYKQCAVVAREQPIDEGNILKLVGREIVLRQESRQLAIRVENVAMLIATVEGAFTQSPQQGQRLSAAQQP